MKTPLDQGKKFFENVDFTNTSYSLGVEIETIDKLKLIYGMMNIESSGFEYLSLRNASKRSSRLFGIRCKHH